MKNALENKVVVIIGGTSGLGSSAARACVAAGARVVVVGRNEAKWTEVAGELSESARFLAGDAADPDVASAAIQLAIDEFAGLDGLYHVAGGSGRKFGDGPLHEISDEGWEATLRLNLTSLFHSNRAATKQFLAQGSGGSILNMSSVLGFSPSPKHFATHAYAASKAAVCGLARASAAYYADRGIRFNVLAPALVDTPMAERAARDDDIQEYIRQKQPLDGGRIGHPADLDEAVVYFLSDASRFVTGQVLAIDGGWSVSEA